MHAKPALARSLAVAMLAAVTFSGCATVFTDEPTTPTYRAFGDAVRQARAQQTLNPQASRANREPVTGLEGPAAVNAMNAYVDSYKEPPPTFNVLGIGAGSVFSAGH